MTHLYILSEKIFKSEKSYTLMNKSNQSQTFEHSVITFLWVLKKGVWFSQEYITKLDKSSLFMVSYLEHLFDSKLGKMMTIHW